MIIASFLDTLRLLQGQNNYRDIYSIFGEGRIRRSNDTKEGTSSK